jgi:hypothetical protein
VISHLCPDGQRRGASGCIRRFWEDAAEGLYRGRGCVLTPDTATLSLESSGRASLTGSQRYERSDELAGIMNHVSLLWGTVDVRNATAQT